MTRAPKGGRAPKMIGGKKVSFYLDAPTLEKAAKLGHGNVSAGIREAVKASETSIKAWIGYTDGRPYVFKNDHGQHEWCVFTNREHARQAFQDVRRCEIRVIDDQQARGKA